jgi:hypothetical protein
MTKKDKDLASARIQLEHIKGILEQTMELVNNIDKKFETTQNVEEIVIFSNLYDEMCDELGVEEIETMGIS